MAVYGTAVLDDLLGRIHVGQTEVIGEDLRPFKRLLDMGYAAYNGEGGPDRYTEVLLTESGTLRVLDPRGEIGCKGIPPDRGEDMQISKAEAKLLMAIHGGITVVKGEDVATLKVLISRGFADGKDASSGDGLEYISVCLTQIGREIVVDLVID